MTGPIVFTEENVRFEFDPAVWVVEKWDDSPMFLDGIRKLNGELSDPRVPTGKTREGTKAVDFIGVHDEALYLFEVKDFRGYQAANASRQEKELPLEIGLKVRDTLAGIVGEFSLRRPVVPWIGKAVHAVLDKQRPVRVVAWIVEDKLQSARSRREHNKTANVRSKQLLQRLAWLTRQAWVDNPLDPSMPLPGIRAHTFRAPP